LSPQGRVIASNPPLPLPALLGLPDSTWAPSRRHTPGGPPSRRTHRCHSPHSSDSRTLARDVRRCARPSRRPLCRYTFCSTCYARCSASRAGEPRRWSARLVPYQGGVGRPRDGPRAAQRGGSPPWPSQHSAAPDTETLLRQEAEGTSKPYRRPRAPSMHAPEVSSPWPDTSDAAPVCPSPWAKRTGTAAGERRRLPSRAPTRHGSGSQESFDSERSNR
jgi:hypothetical protein